MRRIVNLNFLTASAIVFAMIAYGSLYPFAFHQPEYGLGPVRTLIGTWNNPPRHGDFIVNMLFYAPFGFFGVMAIRAEFGLIRRLLVILLASAALSIILELAQYFDRGRVTSAQDVYANLLGTAIGALAGVLLGPGLRWRFLARANKPFPGLILAAWLGYRLFPFMPEFNLHKYWNALKPILLQPGLTSYDLFRYTVSWLTVCALVEALTERKRSLRLFPVLALAVLVAKIVIVGKFLSAAEILGAGFAFALWCLLINRPERLRAAIIATLLCVYVISWRLEPFEFGDHARAFGWVPFLEFMRGSVIVNAQSFLEKVFYYGALIWLITMAGARLRTAAIGVALVLFATSLAELRLPGRSAGVTDGVIALFVAILVAALRPAGLPARSRAVAPRRNP